VLVLAQLVEFPQVYARHLAAPDSAPSRILRLTESFDNEGVPALAVRVLLGPVEELARMVRLARASIAKRASVMANALNGRAGRPLSSCSRAALGGDRSVQSQRPDCTT